MIIELTRSTQNRPAVFTFSWINFKTFYEFCQYVCETEQFVESLPFREEDIKHNNVCIVLELTKQLIMNIIQEDTYIWLLLL